MALCVTVSNLVPELKDARTHRLWLYHTSLSTTIPGSYVVGGSEPCDVNRVKRHLRVVWIINCLDHHLRCQAMQVAVTSSWNSLKEPSTVDWRVKDSSFPSESPHIKKPYDSFSSCCCSLLVLTTVLKHRDASFSQSRHHSQLQSRHDLLKLRFLKGALLPNLSKGFLYNKTNRCTNFTNLFCHESLHVSDSSSLHHQEFIHCTRSAMVYVVQVCRQLTSGTRMELEAIPSWSCSKAVYKPVRHIP